MDNLEGVKAFELELDVEERIYTDGTKKWVAYISPKGAPGLGVSLCDGPNKMDVLMQGADMLADMAKGALYRCMGSLLGGRGL